MCGIVFSDVCYPTGIGRIMGMGKGMWMWMRMNKNENEDNKITK